MVKRFSYTDCYKILNIQDATDLEKLKIHYKKQVQKWHPDRFSDQDPTKEIASEKIKQISTAYRQITSYFKDHGEYPALEILSSPTRRDKPQPQTQEASHQTQKTTQTNYRYKPAPRKKKKRFVVFLVLFSCIYLIYLIYLYFSDVSVESLPSHKESIIKKQMAEKSARQNETSTDNPIHAGGDDVASEDTEDNRGDEDKHPKPAKSYFTYGSSVGQVINAQGIPTRVEGDTWFYGESSVLFENGHVKSWVRTSGSPLNIELGE